MDQQTFNLITRRGEAMGRVTERTLNYEDETDEIAGVGFRWAYLILRRPRRYLEAFRAGDLSIDPSLLREAFWHFRADIPGPHRLLPEEEEILSNHNTEAEAWMQRQGSRALSVVPRPSETLA